MCIVGPHCLPESFEKQERMLFKKILLKVREIVVKKKSNKYFVFHLCLCYKGLI